ncbi:hypothetical protein [Brumimicrobium salinarum]|nr:hypothetical protein [Brumimicrobium salinarum]
MQRNYYTVRNNKIYLTFSCPVFDHIGEANPEAYAIKHKESSVRIAKDIAMYNGVIEDYSLSSIDNPNGYTPKNIISTGELYVYFIFDSSDMKYKTPMQSPTEDEN